jgi:hypothetical protein
MMKDLALLSNHEVKDLQARLDDLVSLRCCGTGLSTQTLLRNNSHARAVMMSSSGGSDHGRMNEPVGRHTVSTVFPRRKPNALRASNLALAPVSITLDILEQLASLSLPIAASKLGISATAMKNACRKLGISRWPYLPSRCTSRDLTLADHAADVKRVPSVCIELMTQPNPIPEMVCAETQTDLTFTCSHFPDNYETIPTSVVSGNSSDVFSTTLELPRSRASSVSSEVSAVFASYGYS